MRAVVAIKRAWHPTVTLIVFAMAVGSAVTGNDIGVTLLLFAIALVNAALLLVEYRNGDRREA